ncbi:HNH endonuclease [Dehalococcoides mccartyi]|uniref:HNH endonuclease n=1 Tax=Dehalococcoides mccartyi TaxID=61435 RepID=UPI0002B765A5|nr:HNH endonuclease [Dehalococcoides mccartyi]AGG05890.1 hypothetical protein dcmb_259 [Dehalococcoides mccartyi DCMB5]
MVNRNWTREETILAFSLYCQTPFGRIHSNNPQVRLLASKLDRTPSAVSMKMCNFGRFDPALKSRNVSGLCNGSKIDQIIWDEFSHDNESLIFEAAKIQEALTGTPISEEIDLSDLPDLPEGDEKERIVFARVNQHFFRKVLLSSYDSKCCITGLNVPELLVASHIKPWQVSDSKTERTKPSNGLLLNALHDKAFDRGYISVDTNYRIMVSSKLAEYNSSDICRDWLLSFKGKQIFLPDRFVPEQRFLEYHNDVVFIR